MRLCRWRLVRGALVAMAFAGGCGSSEPGGTGGTGGTGAPATATAPTWHKDVAPIVSAHCTGCHRDGGIAPFSLTSYAAARPLAGLMAKQVKEGAMPPWFAVDTPECKPRYSWKDDVRLSDAEKATLAAWAEHEAPEGDAKTAARLPPPPETGLGQVSAQVAMAKPFMVEGSRDVFRCFPLPYQFAETVWLTGLQVVPGNAKVVHHVLVWLDKAGAGERLAGEAGHYECFGAPGFGAELLAAWAPGATPIAAPPDVGLQVPKGSRIVINVHYHPAGGAQLDASSIDLRWSTTKPKYEMALALLGNARGADDGLMPGTGDPPMGGPAFLIPAGARNHVETMQLTIPPELDLPLRIVAVGTHMHYVGTDMRFSIDRSGRKSALPPGDATRDCLIETPRWNFHWQRAYAYDAPFDQLPTVRAGDVLQMRCEYDNSLENPHVVTALREQGLTAPRDVRLGEQTLDEMCLGAIAVAYPARP